MQIGSTVKAIKDINLRRFVILADTLGKVVEPDERLMIPWASHKYHRDEVVCLKFPDHESFIAMKKEVKLVPDAAQA
jgi:hypothetical protein